MLVFSILYWIVDSRYQDFLNNHQEVSIQSLKGTANEIQQYINHSRQLAKILVIDYKSLIQDLVKNPDDTSHLLKLNKSIKQFFPEAINFTLTDSQGLPLLEDPDSFIGKGCSTDIKRFSDGIHLNEIYIHSNPNPDNYHLDILAEIHDMGDSTKGVFFVSLDTRNLQRLLKNGEPSSHQFFLLRKDKQTLIEMTSKGTRASLKREESLQEYEIKNIISSVEISGTRWKMVDILSPKFKNMTHYNLQRDALIVGTIIFLFSVIYIIFALIHERKRLMAELEVKALNESLEDRVQQRTKDLHDSKTKLNFQAIHDHLTGLINRREFEYRLEDLIIKAKNDAIESVILYMDLDQFKVVNDTAGHTAGDELLRQITSLLKNELRGADTLARLGGDEFGILLENCPINKATSIAEQLRKKVNDFTFEWTDRIYHVGISIGVMIIDSNTTDISEVMSTVDACCYEAKAKGRNSIHVYSLNDSQLQTQHNKMFWASETIQAIASGRMELYCQLIKPINADDQMLWYEVLVRIRDRQGKLVYPDSFIPALESYGGIEQLDLAVLSAAIRIMSEHQNVRFNINISGASLSNKKFHEKALSILREYRVAPAQIVFEITETAVVTNLSIVKEFINTMKNFGCSVALDDFGTGMSSFSFLKNIDVDYIKLDGSFVKDIHKNPINNSMVNAINSVAQVMGKIIIAEFVENEEVSVLLKEMGIGYGQGYYYHRPEPLTSSTIHSFTELHEP
ncbi:MAG: EAL domain-containing protein [gamma proteobacterium symbiont of Lucinoma myriamae]|nr:EAL domain-containing protein [gamma proteobacterium symbiont of Lucinoma myriamae]MCU7818699.1 EAL domain-containing protein [gamma proteobacterium symbiont of Lucinoma myriamae]MCU7832519.1 EAL domain-containing protein [gamma proteobacterium symbiont of Lucinoma myriamae]